MLSLTLLAILAGPPAVQSGPPSVKDVGWIAFPKKIGYKRSGDSLTAWIEGPMGGQARRIEFPYTKGDCSPR
jgi:hypothetical protein